MSGANTDVCIDPVDQLFGSGIKEELLRFDEVSQCCSNTFKKKRKVGANFVTKA